EDSAEDVDLRAAPGAVHVHHCARVRTGPGDDALGGDRLGERPLHHGGVAYRGAGQIETDELGVRGAAYAVTVALLDDHVRTRAGSQAVSSRYRWPRSTGRARRGRPAPSAR